MYIRCILSLKLCNSLYLQQPGPEHCGARVEGEDHPGWSADSWIQRAAFQPIFLVSRVRTILLPIIPISPNITTSNPTTTTPTTSHLSTTWDQMYTNEPTAGLSATSDPALILGGKCSYTRVYTVYSLHYISIVLLYFILPLCLILHVITTTVRYTIICTNPL